MAAINAGRHAPQGAEDQLPHEADDDERLSMVGMKKAVR